MLSFRFPLFPAEPISTQCTSASVPANLTSAVCTSTLYVIVLSVGRPSGPSGKRSSDVPLVPPSSNHAPPAGTSKCVSSPVSIVRITTSAKHHADPNPELSCPILALLIPAPRPATSSSNRSVFPRANASRPPSSANAPLLFPDAPTSSIHTRASVPAALTSAVVTVIAYCLFTRSPAACCSASSLLVCSVTKVSPPGFSASSQTFCGHSVFSHPSVTHNTETDFKSHPGFSPAPLCPIRACVISPRLAARMVNVSVAPLAKLSGALSSAVSRITVVRPSGRRPAAEKTTPASVLAPFASPVTTVTT